MEMWHLWVIAGIVMFVLEIFTPVFIEASFGVGCFAAAIAAIAGVDFKLQLLVFAITVLAVFFGVRPFFQRYVVRYSEPRKTGVEALIGRTCKVIETINNVENTGRVQIGGETWKASSENGETIEAGETVIVKRIEGVTAYVIKQSGGV